MNVTFEELSKQIKSYYSDANLSLITKAYEFSERAHAGQIRASGEPFVHHPLEVASILARLHMDVASIVAAILHDVIEDTQISFEHLEKEFGKEVAELVDGVTKLSKIKFKNIHEKQAENFRKMIVAMAKDIRVIIIKLADRLHNMRTLEHLPLSKQYRIAQETQDIYAPLANRLGIGWIKMELEDLSLKYLNPEAYEKLTKQVAKNQEEREEHIEKTIKIIREKLIKHGLTPVDVMGRHKHYYSIYKKMQERNLEFEQLYDLIAFRIIVRTIPECYEVLGMIHSIWKPIPGRFKDFIAIPKANSYQSLHTAVIGPKGERLEIQMRTEEMHQVAEEGIAAHWEYKEGSLSKKDIERFTWVRQLLEWQKDVRDSSEFLDTMKWDLFPGDVYVFTPKGDVVELPAGATVIDFAYSIHTDVGHRCIGAKVDGKMVPLKYVLRSGDTAEILTQAEKKPNKQWLSFVKSSRAKAKIRTFIKGEERKRGLELGKELCEKVFRKHHFKLTKYENSPEFLKVVTELGHKDVTGLFVAVGYGFISPHQIIQKFFPSQDIKKETQEPSLLRKIFQQAAKKSKARSVIKIKGEEDVLIRFANCCNPLPGDPIVGFVTRGRGVSVHMAGCSKMLASDPERKIEVEWDSDTKAFHHSIKVKVVCIDASGLLVKMSRVFTDHGVNISKAQIRTTRDRKAICFFDVNVENLEQLQKVMKAMQAIDGVISVDRI